MNLIQESFQRLFPEREFPYQAELEYNRRLADFNANIRLHRNMLKVNLNMQWKDIDSEIRIGLIQHLLAKLFHSKQNTSNIELYHNFIKNIPVLTPKIKSDPALAASFQNINALFFSNQMERPNLQWGMNSFRKLASYNFHNDTITISSRFQDTSAQVLDYLMYHELLHKHYQFSHRNGRSSFHSREFKQAEQQYPDHDGIEREITAIIRSGTKKRRLWRLW